MAGGFRVGLVDRMNQLQQHRGPDGRGVYEDPERHVSLGHVRLSILDLSDSASQPMTTADGGDVIVFNGEIYNFQSLRERLQGLGHRFSSSGDTEVLLTALRQWGEQAIEMLNGMFAFAWWNAKRDTLVLARDRVGIKPLYYSVLPQGELLFASEIKALLAHPELETTVNPQAFQQHLAFGHSCGTRTILDGVQRLTPGGLLRYRVSRRSVEQDRFWRMPVIAKKEPEPTESQWGGRTLQAVQESVDEQMIADVPVGAFLSGGLDSSLITAIAARHTDGLRSYACGYTSDSNQLDSRGDDLPYARDVANRLHLDHVELLMESDCVTELPELLYHLDEPLVDPASICCYVICKRARQDNVPVLLSGQGADELFAGYPRYHVMQSTAWMDHLPLIARQSIASVASLLPGAMSGKLGGLTRRVRRVLTGLNVSADQRFIDLCSATPVGAIREILSAEMADPLRDHGFGQSCIDWMNASDHVGTERYLQRDIAHYLPNHNLLYTDKMGMAVGIEARVPLLDNRLVQLAAEIPMRQKINAGESKIPLRRAAKGVVPDSVLNRSKAGFGLPYRGWLRNELAEMWDDIASAENLRRRGWFDPASVARIREDSQKGRRDLYMLQWAVITMELWARRFIDARSTFL
jgi:asparagine synthase (glutamine-hydrolysing)